MSRCRHYSVVVFTFSRGRVKQYWCKDCGALRHDDWKGWLYPDGSEAVEKHAKRIGAWGRRT